MTKLFSSHKNNSSHKLSSSYKNITPKMPALKLSALALTLGLLAFSPFISSSPTLADEVEIETQSSGLTLKGTYLKAENSSAPIALIIPGSGPTDRDGNNPMGVAAQPYRLLAEALAEKSISSVRIDKRGMFGSANEGFDGNKVTIQDYASDIAAWTTTIKAETGADCVWLAGHSEGGLVAMASAQTNTDICGLILISAGGYRMSDIIRRQLKANPANAPILPPALEALDTLEAGEHADTSKLHPALMPIFNEAIQDYLIDVFSYDPAELLKSYNGPVLVLQGTKDLQVTLEDAERLKGAGENITLTTLENVNHVLKVVEASDPMSNMQTYGNPNLPLAPGIAEAIESFVKK